MKKIISMFLVMTPVLMALQAQTPVTVKKVMELQMPRTVDDAMPGTRGASVAWHPLQKKYYAAFAGNTDYPLAVFDLKGKLLSGEDLNTMADVRGLWYDPIPKKITGNGYSETGWFTYILDNGGIPTDYTNVYEGMYQPIENSVGIFNPATKQVLFLSGAKMYFYNSEAQLTDSLLIHWGEKKTNASAADDSHSEGPALYDYNTSNAIFTGIKGQELGFLNVNNNKIELYDIKTGYLVKTIILPEDAVLESMFNFAYANGIYWLFNIKERKWVGYK